MINSNKKVCMTGSQPSQSTAPPLWRDVIENPWGHWQGKSKGPGPMIYTCGVGGYVES